MLAIYLRTVFSVIDDEWDMSDQNRTNSAEST